VKYIAFLLLLLLPFGILVLFRQGFTGTGLVMSAIALIIYILATGFYGLKILMNLFKQDYDHAMEAVFGLLASLGLVLLTVLIMVGNNPADRADHLETPVESKDTLR
jgi:sulfur carrier protein ThiS